jgi:hypothetical protein
MLLGGGCGIVGGSSLFSPVTTVYPFEPLSTETFALYPCTLAVILIMKKPYPQMAQI